MFRSTMRRLGMTAALAVAGLMFVAAPASAHVTVNPSEAPREGYTKVAFRVPNERDDAGTTKLEIVVDKKATITFAAVKPLAGWKAEITKRKLDKPLKDDDGREVTEAVDRITWTAQDGTRVEPGQFQEFEVSMGPLPDTDKVVFKAIQTYSNGEVVNWIDESHDADNPAPVLTLTKAGDDHPGSSTEEADDEHDDDDDSKVDAISVAALVVGVLGLVVGTIALVRSRRA